MPHVEQRQAALRTREGRFTVGVLNHQVQGIDSRLHSPDTLRSDQWRRADLRGFWYAGLDSGAMTQTSTTVDEAERCIIITIQSRRATQLDDRKVLPVLQVADDRTEPLGRLEVRWGLMRGLHVTRSHHANSRMITPVLIDA